MTLSADTDVAHLSRAIALAGEGRGRVSPNPLVGAVVVARRAGAGGGLPRRLRRPPRRGRGARRVPATRPARRDAVRLARAVLPPGPDAALHRRDRSRPGSRASSSPPTTRPRRPPAAGWASCATRASRSSSPTASRPSSARLLNQAVPQARAHRPPARPLQVGDDARRQGRDPDRRLEVDLRRASRGCCRTAGAPRATRSRSASARRSPTTRSSPPASRASPRQPRRVVFDSEARLPLDSQLVRGAPRCRSPWSSAAPRRGSPPTRSRPPAPTSSSPPARTSPRACAPRSTSSGRPGVTSILLEGGPRLAGAFLDAGEVDEIRLFVAPVVVGGSNARDPLEGEGVERIAEATRALDARVRADRRRRADLGAAAGVVSVFTGLVQDLGTVDGGRRRRRRRARSRVRTRLAGRARRGRLGGRQRRLPDRDGGAAATASAPT